MSVSHCCLVWCLYSGFRGEGGQHGETELNGIYTVFHMQHLPVPSSTSEQIFQRWVVPRCAMLGTSRLRARGFFTWNLSRTWLACFPLGLPNLLASNNILFLACHARTHVHHATSSLPCVHSFHAGRRIQGRRGGVVREVHASSTDTAAPPPGGVEGTRASKMSLPGFGRLREKTNSRSSRMPIKALRASWRVSGLYLHSTLERRSGGAGFFPCTVTYAIFFDDETNPSLNRPESRSGFGVYCIGHTLVHGDGRWYCRTSTCYVP